MQGASVRSREQLHDHADHQIETWRLRMQVEQRFQQPGLHQQRIDDLKKAAERRHIEPDSRREVKDAGYREYAQYPEVRGMPQTASGSVHGQPAATSRWFRYQRSVSPNPRSSGMFAFQPNPLSRETSSSFLGVPSGFEASKVSCPWKPVRRLTVSANSRMVRSSPVPTLTSSGE